jgi:hypothetical protein
MALLSAAAYNCAEMRRRLASTTLVAATAGTALAACGSSGTPAAAGSSGVKSDTALQFSQCMRTHGVPNFPDPGASGGLQITGLNPQSPVFQAARQACQRFAPAKAGPPKMSESQRQAAFRFAQCMRANGQSAFPDPTFTQQAGASRVLVMRGMVFALGAGIDPKSPAFRQAAAKCGVTPPSGPPVAQLP